MTPPAGARPVLEWDDLEVGQRFGPTRYEVTPARVAAYRQALGDHEVDEVEGEPVAPPTLLTFPVLQVLEHRHAAKPGAIHAAQELELLAPLRAGAVLECTGVVTAKERRRGRRWFTVEVTVVDDRHVPVARAVTTGVHP